MQDLLAASVSGLAQVFTLNSMIYLMAGLLLGFMIGLIPGLSGVQGMAMLLPLVYDKPPAAALALLMGMYAVTTLSDTIPAVLIGVPGTSAAQAAVLDGHPMAKRGEAGRALGAAYMCHIIATVLGVLVFVAMFPALRSIILLFAAPELFMLGILGISLVGYLGSGRHPMRGIIVAGFGLMLSMIGLAPQAGFPRFHFGLLYLWDMPMVPVLLGLYGIPEMIGLLNKKQQTISDTVLRADKGMWQGMADGLQHWFLMVRAGIIGAFCGILPAMGGPIAEWWGYGHAVQTAKDKSQFGKGDVRGLIGSEAAVAAQKPAALIPTVAFGIPGNTPMAIMLGAFLILGLKPGPDMLTKHLDLTMLMMWTIVLANILGAIIAIALSNSLARLTTLRITVLVPVVLAFMAIGSVASNGHIGAVITMAVFGILGYIMEITGWPRAPLVLGLILGKMIETYLFIAVQAYGWSWLSRPIVMILIAIILSTYLLPPLLKRLIPTRHASKLPLKEVM